MAQLTFKNEQNWTQQHLVLSFLMTLNPKSEIRFVHGFPAFILEEAQRDSNFNCSFMHFNVVEHECV
jgi:hypothetical protein